MQRSISRFALATGLAITLFISLFSGGIQSREAQAFSTTISAEPSKPAPIYLILPAVQSVREAAR